MVPPVRVGLFQDLDSAVTVDGYDLSSFFSVVNIPNNRCAWDAASVFHYWLFILSCSCNTAQGIVEKASPAFQTSCPA